MVKISTLARNQACDAIVDLIDIGSANANGIIEIRTGAPPSSPQASASGTLLATLDMNSTAFSDAANGTATAAAITGGSVVATGTAGWFRIYNKDNTAILDGTITTLGGGGDLQLDRVDFQTGGIVQISSMLGTMPI